MLVWHDESSSSPSNNSIATTWKTASRNYYKNLTTIKRSVQKLRRFWTVTLVEHDETCSLLSSDFIATTRKTTSGHYCKNLSTIQR
jgi:esterase/lipase